eukprot:1161159-Pelagomonas_calceolata.AAC.3
MGILIASGNKGKRHTSHLPTRTAVLLRGRGTVSFPHQTGKHIKGLYMVNGRQVKEGLQPKRLTASLLIKKQ